ncbi:hypothetical protein VTK56DRAFT_1624 [Thermocarpiscus australiensis]
MRHADVHRNAAGLAGGGAGEEKIQLERPLGEVAAAYCTCRGGTHHQSCEHWAQRLHTAHGDQWPPCVHSNTCSAHVQEQVKAKVTGREEGVMKPIGPAASAGQREASSPRPKQRQAAI